MSTAEIASINSESDIFAHKPVQTPVLGTNETATNLSPTSIKMVWIFYYLQIKITTYISVSNSTSEVN